jgi:hypothetical protein
LLRRRNIVGARILYFWGFNLVTHNSKSTEQGKIRNP